MNKANKTKLLPTLMEKVIESVRVSDAYGRYRNGDHLTTPELDKLIEVTEGIYNGIVSLGDPMFDLFKVRILRDLQVLQGYKRIRKDKPNSCID